MEHDYGKLVASFRARKSVLVNCIIMGVIGGWFLLAFVTGMVKLATDPQYAAYPLTFYLPGFIPFALVSLLFIWATFYYSKAYKNIKIEFYEKGLINYETFKTFSVSYSEITEVKGKKSYRGGIQFFVSYKAGYTCIKETLLEKGMRPELERVTNVHFI